MEKESETKTGKEIENPNGKRAEIPLFSFQAPKEPLCGSFACFLRLAASEEAVVVTASAAAE